MTASNTYRFSVPVGDVQIAFELDLQESREITNGFRDSAGKGDGGREGFIFGAGYIYVARSSADEHLLFGGQEIGNFMELLNRWEVLASDGATACVELRDVCSAGEVASMIRACLTKPCVSSDSSIDQQKYDRLMKAVIERNNDADLLCYSMDGELVVEVSWREETSSTTFYAAWQVVDADRLAKDIREWRRQMAHAYFQFKRGKESLH
jgi:hypothetical protein